MVERGISLARTLFAFNSVNVEGWALYAEAEMLPYEPLDGQMIALQLRLLRGARAVLDPMLNLGLIDRESARRVLEEEVGVSPAMAKQELDRYMFNAPGQAGDRKRVVSGKRVSVRVDLGGRRIIKKKKKQKK